MLINRLKKLKKRPFTTKEASRLGVSSRMLSHYVGQGLLKSSGGEILGQGLIVHPQTHKVEDARQILTVASGKLVVDSGLLGRAYNNKDASGLKVLQCNPSDLHSSPNPSLAEGLAVTHSPTVKTPLLIGIHPKFACAAHAVSWQRPVKPHTQFLLHP